MLTELNLFKEFAICSIDQLRDEKNQNGRNSSHDSASQVTSNIDTWHCEVNLSAYVKFVGHN